MALRPKFLVRSRTARVSILSLATIALLGAVLALTNGSPLSAGAINTSRAGGNGASLCFGQVAVSQQLADAETIIDQNSNLVTHTIGVQALPGLSEYSGDGRFLFVSSYQSQSIAVIDTATNTVLRTLSFGASYPARFTPSVDGSILWVNVFDGTSYALQKIDALTGTALTPQVAIGQIYAMFLSPDGTTLWTAQSGFSVDILEINATTLATLSITPTPANGWSLSMNRAGSFIYLADASLSGVVVFDTATKAVTRLGSVMYLRELVVSPSGTTLYGVAGPQWHAVAIDTATGAETQGVNLTSLAAGGPTNGIDVTADGTKIYIAVINYANGGLVVLQTSNIATGSFIPLEVYAGPATCPLAVDPALPVATTTLTGTDPLAPAFTG